MNREEVLGALEAVIFAAGEPVSARGLKKILERWAHDQGEEGELEWLAELPDLLETLLEKWSTEDGRGFGLVKVAEGYTFRSNPNYGDVLRAMREQKPVRLSKAALETLAIIAYRQPATKPEIDHIRGVDCGGTIRMLLDRNLVRIIGKKDEPGRPLLYGTSREFLSFFNLKSLGHLPTLRDVQELSQEAEEELKGFDGLNLEDLKEAAKTMQLEEEPSLEALDEAMVALKDREKHTRQALAAEGIELVSDEDDDRPATTQGEPQDASSSADGASASSDSAPSSPGARSSDAPAPGGSEGGNPDVAGAGADGPQGPSAAPPA